MSAYSLTLLALTGAVLTQLLAAALASGPCLRSNQSAGQSRSWLALTLGSLLLTLHHGYTLELALRTGLYDLPQSVLAALVGMLFALGVFGLRPQAT